MKIKDINVLYKYEFIKDATVAKVSYINDNEYHSIQCLSSPYYPETYRMLKGDIIECISIKAETTNNNYALHYYAESYKQRLFLIISSENNELIGQYCILSSFADVKLHSEPSSQEARKIRLELVKKVILKKEKENKDKNT